MVKLTRSKTVSDKKDRTLQTKGIGIPVAPKTAIAIAKKSVTKKQKKELPVKSFIQIKKEILPPKNHKVTIVDKTEKIAATAKLDSLVHETSVVKSKVLPSILSRYRFPLLPEKHIGTVSKIAGVLLVVSGVFLSFFNVYSEAGTYAQLPFFQNLATLLGSQNAQVIARTSVTVTTNTVVNPDDTKPEPRIATDAHQPFSGIIPVSIIVPSATDVKLILEDVDGGRLSILGSATRFDNSTWKYDLQTTDFSDGKYRLKTIIKNQNGTYESILDTVYTILNDQTKKTDPTDISENTLVATSSPLTASSTTSPDEEPPIVHHEDESLSSVLIQKDDEFSSDESILLKVSARDATDVKVYARNEKTSALFYVGLARQKTPETWYVEWKTDNIPRGIYTVLAKARIKEQLTESKIITVSVTGGTDTKETVKTASSTAVINDADLKPEISLQFSKEAPFTGSVTMKIQSTNMSWVELYALPQSSLTPFFLGLANKVNPVEWKFVWETKQTPNGEYSVYARGKTIYGFVEGSHQKIQIANGVATDFTESEEKRLDTYIEAKNSLTRKVEDADILSETGSSSVLEPEDQAYVQPIASFMKEVEIGSDSAPEVQKVLQEFRTSLQEKLERLSLAERANNQEEIQNNLSEIESLKQDTIRKIPKTIENKDVTLRIEGYVYQIISVLQELTINNERILRERIGDTVTQDSDKDDISDYDEINLYKTNPFVADTDGDSFIDGLEVKGGFDPHNSIAEALITHESPRENGALREDLLFVESVTALRSETDENDSVDTSVKPAKAIISGKGLPNSFVTIYVYSTPVVVTVRTDAEGNWSYIFDKELEEGSHEVYVGLTDNQGRIVAKSKPLSFVKKAEAFTNAGVEVLPTIQATPQTIDVTENIILLLGSVLVVVLGLILIILGVHITKRRHVQGLATVSL